MDRTQLFAYLEERFPHYLSEVQQFLRPPSISYTGEGILDFQKSVVAFFDNYVSRRV